MTKNLLAHVLFAAGAAQFGILIASAIVPVRLHWRTELASLSRLHRQMYWVYGGYVVLSIVAFGALTMLNARELAEQSALARGVSLYIAVFWGIRVVLQSVFDVEEHLTAWWLSVGYTVLTLVFASLTLVYAWAALGGVD
jgi:hypothetical protein